MSSPRLPSLPGLLAASVSALLLSLSPAAQADRSQAPKATVIAVLPEAGQALLLDKDKSEYILIKAGDRVQGFEVRAVSEDDVILSHPSRPGREWVLPRVSELVTAARPLPAPRGPATSSLINPYPPISATVSATVSTSGAPPAGPVDPYAVDSLGNGSWTTVLAPLGSRASDQPVASPQDPYASGTVGTGTPPAAPSPASPADALTASGPPLKPVTAGIKPDAMPAPKIDARAPTVVARDKTPAVARDERMSLVRAEFDTGLADFNRLSKEVTAELTGSGILLQSVAKGSFIHRLGLRSGDRVLSVADKRIRSIDDAAGAYAAIAARDTFKIVVERGGDTLTLHYRFVK